MIYHFSIDSLIEFITAFAALVTILILWKYRESPEVKLLIFLELFVAIWALTYAFEFGTNVLKTKILWSKLSYFGIAFTPMCYFFFTMAFSQKNKLINRRNIIILAIIPIITILLVLTNDVHRLVWTDVTADPYVNIAHYHHGPWFWVYFVYAQGLVFSGLFTLMRSIYKFTSYYKSQVSTLLIASVIPILGNLMYVSDINPYPGFDWTPVSFVLTGFFIAFGIVRYRIFDLVPFARNKLIDTMDDGVIVVNNEGFIEDNNNAVLKMFCLGTKSIIRKSFENIFGDYEPLISAIRENRNESFMLEFNGNNGINYFQVNISPIYYQNNKFSGNLIVVHDVTVLKETENELKKTNSQLMGEIENREKLIDDLDAFAHTVAHDLKNSLGSIVSSSEIMEELIRSNDTKLLNELAGLIKSSASKTLQITQELLILATVSHQEIEKRDLNMAQIFSEAKNQLRETIQTSKAIISEPETWPVAVGYAPWIEEVWMNYLSNAIKYGGNSPVIEVGADLPVNGCVKFWIKDNGNGISESEQDKLFKKYIRLTPTSADGYGLGLSIVKRIIEKIGGTCGVESTGKTGEGSKFYFILNTH